MIACADETGPQEARSDESDFAGSQVIQATVTPVPESGNETAPPTAVTRPAPQMATPFPGTGSERPTPGLPARIVLDLDAPPDRDLAELAARLRGAELDGAPAADTPPMSEGDQQDFWITNLDDGSARPITATLWLVSENAYWFVDDAVSVDHEDLAEAARLYEDQVRPAVVSTFGDIINPGLDGDPRLVILHSKLNGAAGYFGSKDSFPTEVHPHSNEREMIYMDVQVIEDELAAITASGGPIYRPDDRTPGSDIYMGIIAHELQHAVHLNQDVGEESWVNEGLSELATEVAGYAIRSPYSFMRRPQTQLNFWADNPRVRFPHYGASGLFFRYLNQRVGGPQNLAPLLDEQLDGIEGVDAFLRIHGLTFAEVFADWVVANYLDADDERFGYPNHHVNKLPTQTLKPDRSDKASTPQFSARYHVIDADTPSASLRFQGDTQVKQVATDCAQGPTCWWSGRGDGIDTKLTREFDLTGLDRATLKFDVWHEIEEGWDYGYVEASDDGGRTWRILEGEHTTTYNPSGNAYGPGYTGSSGGWLRESIDLTPFSGGPVLLRFEYVTDDAVYLDGLMIDGVSVSEMGFYGDAIGWTANGFSLAGDTLPQEFIVQIISVASDGSFTVSRLDLDDTNLGQTKLTGTDAETVVIVVSPTTLGTRHSAGYTLEFASSE